MKFEAPENLDTAPESEAESFQEEIEEKVEEKAEELGISKEKLIELAGLDLESLEAEELKESNLGRGDFDSIRSDMGATINEFNKENVDEAISEFERNKKEGEELNGEYLQDKNPLGVSKYEKFAEFAGKHKRTIILGELALYLSSHGTSAFNFLVNSDFNAEINGEKVSLKDLVDDPELIEVNENIDGAYEDLCDLQKDYDAPANENFEHDGYVLSINSEVRSFSGDEDPKDKELVHISFEPSDEKMPPKVSDGTQKILRGIDDISQVEFRGSPSNFITEMTANELSENKEEVIDIISENLNAPRNEVKNYIENVYTSDVSDISVVDFSNFEINQELDDPKFENLKAAEASEYDYEDMDKFEDLFLGILEKEGYTIEELKEIAEENPEKVILIISEVINKNLEYDDDEWEKMKSGNWSEKDEKTPHEALSEGKAICYAYSSAFISAKHILEEKGVPNFDKFVALNDGGGGEKGDHSHVWTEIVTANKEGNLDVSHIDLTDADEDSGLLSELFDSKLTKEELSINNEEFNSKYAEHIEEDHEEDGQEIEEDEEKTEQEKEHKTTFLEKVKNYKLIYAHEKLKKFLTEFDPRQYHRDHRVEGSKKLRETEDDIETLREEKAENVKWSLKKIRERISKL